MLNVISPDPKDDGLPMKKGYQVWANFPVDALHLECREGVYSPLTRGGVRGDASEATLVQAAGLAPCESDVEDDTSDPCPAACAAKPSEPFNPSLDLAEQARLLHTSGGVATGGKDRPAAEAKAAFDAIRARSKLAKAEWIRLARAGKFAEVRVPM